MTARKSHHYLLDPAATLAPVLSDDNLDLDEAEVWSTDNGVVLAEPKKHERPARKPLKVKSMAVDRLPKSLPLNIPDWSKILGGEYRRRAADDEEDEEEMERNDPTPPHEYLARTRGVSFSVHEGVGRRLKGRDLNRVRNAIWKQIGLI